MPPSRTNSRVWIWDPDPEVRRTAHIRNIRPARRRGPWIFVLGALTVGLFAHLVFSVPGVIEPWRHRMDAYREAISNSAADRGALEHAVRSNTAL